MLPTFIQHPSIAARKSLFDPEKHGTYYAHDYAAMFRDAANRPTKEEQELYLKSIIRELVRNDLWAIVYFIKGVQSANHPFVVKLCHEIEDSTPDGGLSHTDTFHNYAREHFKSTVITEGLTIKRIMNDPSCTTGIFSHCFKAASKFLMSIKETFEKEVMYQCFPDVLYGENPEGKTAWSIQNGIRVKGCNSRENTVEAYGLVEGMPVGSHFKHRIYDDMETFDIAKSPDQLDLCYRAFEMSKYLGMDKGTEVIIGTYYSHIGPLVRLRDKKNLAGEPMYKTIVKPGTDDGTRTGKPVLISQERLDKLKMDKDFDAQFLCNPTPIGILALDSRLLKLIEPEFLPRDRYKFMIVDQAGGKDTKISNKKGDRWTAAVISVKPMIDDIGASDCYLEDFISDQFTHAEAIHMIVQMYLRNGYIRQLGVEKVGLSTTEIHVCDGLRAHGRKLSVESRTLVLLNPANRNTEERVEAALQWPLANGKLWMTTDIDESMRQKLIGEMNTFPYSHAEILNAWAYVYDIIKKYRFPTDQEKPEKTVLQIINSAPIRSDFW